MFKLSKKSEYALKALLGMARDNGTRTFSILELSEADQMPMKFLERILLSLKHAGLVRSKRGVGGGYQLTSPTEQITLRQVVEAVEGSNQPLPCSGFGTVPKRCECGMTGPCTLGRIFAEVRSQLHQQLDQISLSDVVKREQSETGESFEI